MVAACLILASVFALACATPAIRNLVVHERRDNVPQGFIHDGIAPQSTTLNLRIALRSKDIHGLEKVLYDVSTPKSELYGQHLSKEEVEAYVTPSLETIAAVNDWLLSHGLKASAISPAGDWLGFSVDVQKANELLDADFSVFTQKETGKQAIRTLSYSIPASLKGHIELVHPTTFFPGHSIGLPIIVSPLPPSGKNVSSDAVSASCVTTVTPACLQALYGIPTASATQPSNKLGVSAFIEQFAQEADLKAFLEMLRPDVDSSTTFTLQTLDGGSNPQSANQAGVEANLDIQYTIGVASGVPTSFISVGDDFSDDVDGFLDLVNFLLGQDAPPQVLTTSYGWNEDDLPESVAVNLCNAYMQLGARGVSILFASGDGGVSGSQSQNCSTFVPTFPSSCPFLTSVGATTGIGPETAASFSSGGFSNYFAIPDYQSSAVSNYLLSLGSANSGKFNTSGRAFPDVSAQGQSVEIFNGGKTVAVSGTSCSSPIFASVISLLNDELIAAGKSPLGFLNPFLYTTRASALNDVITGDNPGCNTDGFPAGTGWDPVTGLGTPNYAALRTAVGL